MFCKKVVLKSFTKFTGKHLCQILFLIKLQASGLRSASLLKKIVWYRCFPVNFAKFSRTAFLQNTSCGCFCGKYIWQQPFCLSINSYFQYLNIVIFLIIVNKDNILVVKKNLLFPEDKIMEKMT